MSLIQWFDIISRLKLERGMQDGYWISKVCSHYTVRFMAFHSLMHADSALPNFRRNMDAYPYHQQYPSILLQSVMAQITASCFKFDTV